MLSRPDIVDIRVSFYNALEADFPVGSFVFCQGTLVALEGGAIPPIILVRAISHEVAFATMDETIGKQRKQSRIDQSNQALNALVTSLQSAPRLATMPNPSGKSRTASVRWQRLPGREAREIGKGPPAPTPKSQGLPGAAYVPESDIMAGNRHQTKRQRC
jgi:hypothetical protein